jgi:hypothetical protein
MFRRSLSHRPWLMLIVNPIALQGQWSRNPQVVQAAIAGVRLVALAETANRARQETVRRKAARMIRLHRLHNLRGSLVRRRQCRRSRIHRRTVSRSIKLRRSRIRHRIVSRSVHLLRRSLRHKCISRLQRHHRHRPRYISSLRQRNINLRRRSSI